MRPKSALTASLRTTSTCKVPAHSPTPKHARREAQTNGRHKGESKRNRFPDPSGLQAGGICGGRRGGGTATFKFCRGAEFGGKARYRHDRNGFSSATTGPGISASGRRSV